MEVDERLVATDDDAPLVIRPATAADAVVLSELIAEFNGPQGDAHETAERIVACTDSEVALIASIPSGVVGFACLRVTPAIGTKTPHALLTELYVRAPLRRQGIARALVERAEALAQQQGASHLFLFTGQRNLTAQAFYERLGYEVRGITYHKPLTR